jgi:hypothetical protein
MHTILKSQKIYSTTLKNVISDKVVSESLMMLLTVPKTDFERQ